MKTLKINGQDFSCDDISRFISLNFESFLQFVNNDSKDLSSYKSFAITRSGLGIPCLWECGGSTTNTGSAIIICDKEGRPKKAIYTVRKGHIFNGEHALIPIKVGDYVITADHWREDFTIEVCKITNIMPDEALVRVEYEYEDENAKGWNKEPPEKLKIAIKKAKEKATCYYCICCHYIKEDN